MNNSTHQINSNKYSGLHIYNLSFHIYAMLKFSLYYPSNSILYFFLFLFHFYAVIEFPGLVKNPHRAIQCLGSISSIQSGLSSQSLPLRFRPNDPTCRPIIGRPQHTVALLLRVTVQTKRIPLDTSADSTSQEKERFSYFFSFTLFYSCMFRE